MEDKEFLEYVIKAIVNNPNDVVVDRQVDELGVLLTLKVNPEDMGQVIGKSGATARAVRTLLRIIGMKSNARVNLKIEEPEGGDSSRPPKRMDQEKEEMPKKETTEEGKEDVGIDDAIGNLD